MWFRGPLNSQQLLLNAAGFQLLWWCCVLLGNSALPLAAALLLLHLWMHPQPQPELRVVVLTAAIGMSVDAVLGHAGLYRFADQAMIPLLQLPWWLLLLWLGFGACLRQSLAWLRPHPLLAAVSGGLAGGASYWAAARLGAVEFPLGNTVTALVIGALWLALLPLLLYLAQATPKPLPGGKPC
ncbi:DUF2878 domain-containing protein [Pseudomaricurvus sp. HS19]|uniref:DUF2878 domain-containing protein n=1 Tax=Pseudomaricurvus sp. HS19 TaxID=2692626 RepID=UPI00136C35AE|nr:DUF2878 domain-containing protein [Pseudomaricurvus sp. HS19]MYM63485.1 DUF2878 family protein [Pseudomaricurvus sp. HS19]